MLKQITLLGFVPLNALVLKNIFFQWTFNVTLNMKAHSND